MRAMHYSIQGDLILTGKYFKNMQFYQNTSFEIKII